jgi:ribonuclease HII
VPWILGIDEAGYGPNLGPFVMTAVACRVPDGISDGDLWRVLGKAVRRHGERRGRKRLLIADSKQVYSPTRGLAPLETAVLACGAAPAFTLAEYVDRFCPDHHPELRDEAWYAGTTALPTACAGDAIGAASGAFAEACAEAGVTFAHIRSAVVCAPRFNALLDRWDNKSVVLAVTFARLLQCHEALAGNEPLSVFVDKHGGRNSYAATLQQALPGGVVLAREEGNARSSYRVEGLPRPVEVTFEPRADAAHFCVALASMFSKYLREVLMLEFNRFWQTQVPGLEPTAGYPVDAARFMDAIRPTLVNLQIAEPAIWRAR